MSDSLRVELERADAAALAVETTGSTLTVEASAAATVTVQVPSASYAIEVFEDDGGSIALTAEPARLAVELSINDGARVTVEAGLLEASSTSAPIDALVVDVGGAGALDQSAHDALRTLAHSIAEPNETEYAYDGDGNPTRITVWRTSARTTKVRETTFTYDGSGNIATVVRAQHSAEGAVLATLTETFTYDGDGKLVTTTTA